MEYLKLGQSFKCERIRKWTPSPSTWYEDLTPRDEIAALGYSDRAARMLELMHREAEKKGERQPDESIHVEIPRATLRRVGGHREYTQVRQELIDGGSVTKARTYSTQAKRCTTWRLTPV